MRKIIVEAEVSIDGAMGGENPDFWQQIFPFHSADVTEYLNDLLFMPDALLMGQKTYDVFRSGLADQARKKRGQDQQHAQVCCVTNPEGAASMERYAHKGGCC